MPLWPSASRAPRLREDEIHVWCAALADFYSDLPRLQATLAPDERLRAGRLHSPDERDAFVVSRGILRQLLAQYLGRDAATVAITYGRFGKPEIAGLQGHLRLYFNMSRSGALVVYAMTSAGPVGVDVERLRPVPELEYIASRFFLPREAGVLSTLPAEAQMEAFFAAWTCQEAFLKTTGDGLAGGPGSRPADPAGHAHLRVDGESRVPDAWQFHLLRPAPGYLATLAHRTDGARLRPPAISERLLTPPIGGTSQLRMHEQ
jgi:4'-phosphopantetheinyl transferase